MRIIRMVKQERKRAWKRAWNKEIFLEIPCCWLGAKAMPWELPSTGEHRVFLGMTLVSLEPTGI